LILIFAVFGKFFYLFLFYVSHTRSILDHVTISQDVAESSEKCADCIEITFRFYESASSV